MPQPHRHLFKFDEHVSGGMNAMSVPGTSAANPFVSFDQAYVRENYHLLFVSSRSFKTVAIFDTLTDRKIGETAGCHS
jgi:hypothetical protein